MKAMKTRILLAIAIVGLLSSCEISIHSEEPIIVDERNKFIGNYQIEEYSDTYDMITEYSISIVKSAYDPEIIFIRNFYGVDIEVLAEVRADYLFIPLQEVNGYEIEGEGWYDHHEITLDYTVRDLHQYRVVNDFCTATAW